MDEREGSVSDKPPSTARLSRRRPPVWFFASLGVLLLIGGGLAVAAKTGRIARYEAANVVIKVRDLDKLPIAGASLTVAGRQFFTDANGRLQLDGLRAGTYSLTVSKDGFVTSDLPLSLKRQENPLEIITLTALPPVRFAVRGYVQDAFSKQPVVNVSVRLGDTSALSDPNGQFSFVNLLPGTLSLQLSANGYASQTLSETVKGEDLVLTSLTLMPTGQIVFDSNRDGKHGIYVASLDGTNQHRLVPAGNGEDFVPLTSPDGNHIVFQSTRDALADSGGHPLRRLYMVGADGSGLRALSPTVAESFNPLWSPDSKRLYFQGYLDPSRAQASRQIYDLAAANALEIADAATNVTFSPNGRFFAYTALNAPTGGSAANSQLKLLPLGSGTIAVLASRPQEIGDLRFTSDESAIGYQVLQGSSIQGYQVSLASHQETSLPVRSDSKRLYVASPDGKLQAFVDQRDGHSNLFVNAADGSNERQLTRLGTVDDLFRPEWDPSGRYLTFASKDATGPQLYGIALSGQDPYHLTEYSPN